MIEYEKLLKDINKLDEKNFSMGKLQIEDRVHQQEEEIDSKKEEESPLAPSSTSST